jgi:CHAT domain-containing protein
LLYEKTGKHEYLEQSFEFAETSKSFALYSEIKDIEAMQFSDLPEEIRQKESRLLGEIQAYEKLIYDEQISENPDLEQIESFKSSLFLLKDDYDDLEHEIELNNTQYYDLKYKPHFVSLAQIQNDLPYKDALIEYVLSDTLLITYVVDRKGINVFSQTVGSEFADECLEFYMLMRHQNFSSRVHDTYKRYVKLGRKLYGILIEPCLEYTDRKNLTIVPDGAITYIPFESLVMKDTETEYINYMTLPYMIKEFSVGYSHSSTLLFSERLKSKSPQNKVLAFAPIYSNPVYEIDSVLMRQVRPESEYMAPLVGTLIEVQSIDETVPADVFINEQATEANFKKNASDYNVLHLAMHTIMKDDDPLYSLLAFSDVEEDTVEDNRLYAYEIYNLKLNAEMAVLSACNSGTGKMQKGEGMMSLARGFIYAGCPSIVMTLWQVTDKSSSELMTSFYRYLKKGKSKQEAMRLAKIDYLEQADDLTSNPYFWSGFVVLGDSHPIYKKSGFTYWMIVITVFVGVMIYMQYRKSRASRNAVK